MDIYFMAWRKRNEAAARIGLLPVSELVAACSIFAYDNKVGPQLALLSFSSEVSANGSGFSWFLSNVRQSLDRSVGWRGGYLLAWPARQVCTRLQRPTMAA